MKKKILYLVAITFCMIAFIGISRQKVSAITEENKDAATGIEMSMKEFNEYFVGAVEARKDLQQLDKSSFYKATLENWVLNGNELSFNVKLRNEIISVSGVLEKGYRGESYLNLNNGVVSEGYKILLGELYVGEDLDTSLLFQKIEGKNIKLYLVKNKEVVLVEAPLLFEVDVPIPLLKEEKEIDIYWFLDIVEPEEIVEIETTDEILKELGVNSVVSQSISPMLSWISPVTYTQRYNIGSDEFVAMSVPHVEYQYSDIQGVTGQWEASFEIAEVTRLNGTEYRAAANPIRYLKVDLELGCGERTAFTKKYISAKAINGGASVGIGTKIDTLIKKKVLSKVPGAVTVTEILSWLRSMSGATESIILGNTNGVLVSSNSQYVSAVGTEFTSLELYQNTYTNGHSAKILTDLKYAQPQGGNNNSVSANGVLRIVFEVYNYHTHQTNHVESNAISWRYTTSPN
ncbi:MAG: hypothetical protein HFI40_08525 [Lachnospiraceae bacterium]|nr:hypothetical protein [Lachnospiraceae bacterium]MCX4316497.1 hypothetical protein [Lachnospiraceae bacterium]